jgi:hypothetical protein
VCWAGEMRRGPYKEGPPQPTGPDCSGRSATSARPGEQLWPVVHMDCRNSLLQSLSCVIEPLQRHRFLGKGKKKTPNPTQSAAGCLWQPRGAPEAMGRCASAAESPCARCASALHWRRARNAAAVAYAAPVRGSLHAHHQAICLLTSCIQVILCRTMLHLSVFLNTSQQVWSRSRPALATRGKHVTLSPEVCTPAHYTGTQHKRVEESQRESKH